LGDLVVAGCPGARIVGSVAAGRPDPADLDILIPPLPGAVRDVLAVLDGAGARWEPDGRRPRIVDLIGSGFGRCTTAYGPVDLFVRDPR
jgi:hypothetical protein